MTKYSESLISNLEEKISDRAFVVGLLAFGILLYARCFSFEITRLDDAAHLNHPDFPALWQQDYLHMYIPVFYQYLAIIKSVSGDYLTQILHAGSVLLHICNALLVGVLSRTVFPNHRAAARIGSILFLLHPLQIEVVAWVSQARESISVGFALLSLICFLRYLHKNRWVYYIGSVILFALGLLAKPGIVALPLMMLLFAIRIHPGKTSWLKQLQLVAPQAALAVLFSIVQGMLQLPSQMLFVTEI